MKTEEKLAVARTGDISLTACAIRLMAARMSIGLIQKQVADAVGTTRSAIGNMEQGRSYPSLPILRFLYREHRIDFNFMMHGDFAQLPLDVQNRLFPALVSAAIEWDQRQSSSPAAKLSRDGLQST